MKKRFEILFYILALFLFASYNAPENDCPENKNELLELPELPASISFAGEKVPMERWDIYQTMDKQLLIRAEDRVTTLLVMKRSKRWERKIKNILLQEGIPLDFFYLMLAESASRNAYSYKGAAGFWQFIPATARLYGLTVNKYIDERLDPVKSTYAACKYFKNAYKKFGNWTNVAASYNMGIAGLARVITIQKEKNFYDLYLNKETSNYIFRILAYKILFENPTAYGFPPRNSLKGYSEPETYSVKITRPLPDLVSFAKKYHTTFRMLKLLNPWILSASLPHPPKGEYIITLPRTEN